MYFKNGYFILICIYIIVPLGWTDQRNSTYQDFHGNIPTGQQAPVGLSLSGHTDHPEIDRSLPPSRPPPPRNPPSYISVFFFLFVWLYLEDTRIFALHIYSLVLYKIILQITVAESR